MNDTTWYYLRESYFPQFLEGVTKLPWDERFALLRELYDADGEDLPWEIRSEDPVADMMGWVAKKGTEDILPSFVRALLCNPMERSNCTATLANV